MAAFIENSQHCSGNLRARELGAKAGATSQLSPHLGQPHAFPAGPWLWGLSSLLPRRWYLGSVPGHWAYQGHCTNSVGHLGRWWWMLTAAKGRNEMSCRVGGTTPILKAGKISPGPLQKKQVNESRLSGRVVSASSLQDRSAAPRASSRPSSTSASGWPLKTGRCTTVRGEEALWSPRRHSVQIQCGF